jgi:hypothetical protein
VEFSISERLMLMGILPKEGNVLTVKVVRELRQALEFSAEELEQYGITIKGTRFEWVKDGLKYVEISAVAKDVIVKALKELDKSGKVNEAQLPLFDKFEVTGA